MFKSKSKAIKIKNEIHFRVLNYHFNFIIIKSELSCHLLAIEKNNFLLFHL